MLCWQHGAGRSCTGLYIGGKERMTDRGKNRIAGAAAGLINGLFGGGGGMVLLPLLTKWGGLQAKKAFATCVAVILPMCAVSAAVCLRQVSLTSEQILPYLLGGVAGGIVGGLTFHRVPVHALRVIFALFLLYAGVRYLL